MPYRTKDQVASEFIAEGKRRGIMERGIVICIATGLVESNLTVYANSKVPESMSLPHDAVGSDGYSVGPLQQQVRKGANGQWWWGPADVCMDPTKSAGLFYDRLVKRDYNHGDPGAHAQAIQQSAFPDRYAQRMAEAQKYYDRLAGQPTQETNVVSGDPVWLEDVLRPALGDRLKTLPGWQDSGVGGTMQEIWGIIWHHTGNGAATAQSIRDGRPDLAGPLSQLHIAQDGTVTIVAVGPCNHAGKGSWPGLPTDDANDRTIGIECAWPRDTSITEATQTRERWPDAQIISMRDVGAALTKYLGVDVSHNISHKEWATQGPAGWRQGKWDPGNLSMPWFRGEIAKDIRGEFDGPTPVTPPPVKLFPHDYTDRELLEAIAVDAREIRAQLGPGDPAWESKGMTLRDKVWSLGKDPS
jgi:hypothetical protein